MMMIMAQHPQRELHQREQQRNHKSQVHATVMPFNEVSRVPGVKTTHNKQQMNGLKPNNEQHHDDNKRSLIKNQLYLIEQLQLENADLRNERDQLQLENEELKFQLQMISSSNILSQSGGTFNNRALVGNGGENGPKVPPLKSGDSSLCIKKTMATNGAAATRNEDITNQTTSKLTSTIRNPTKIISEFRNFTQHRVGNTVVRSLQSPAILDEESVIEITSEAHQRPTEVPPPPTATKSLGCKSTSLTAINVKSVSLATQARQLSDDRDGNEDEDEQRRIFAEQTYGDGERAQAAAIVIQRAFRKYQICKRFRTITEQLRRAGQTSGLTQSERKSEPSSPKASTKGRQVEGFTFASGATRAAAWESLSYAASRLAAAAASATSGKQSDNENQSRNSHQLASQRLLLQPKVSRDQHRQQSQHQPMPDSRVSLKTADPVVAAAINFQQLESIRKRQYRVGLNIFNKSPEKGVSFLIAHSFIDASPPFEKSSSSYYHSNQLHFIDKHHVLHERTVASIRENSLPQCQLCTEEENLKRNVAYFLLHRKGLAKEKIGHYLGNLQENFNQDVLKYYLQELDFGGLQIDLALRKFLSTFRLPGEAQKIERIVDCFAQRYVQCQQLQLTTSTTINVSSAIIAPPNRQQSMMAQEQVILNATKQQQNIPQYKNNLILLSKDEIFILTFAIIMLNTDLHSPSLKPTSRMSSQQFVNNLRGVFKSHNINESDLIEIYDRVKANQIATTPDHVSHVMKVQQGLTANNFQRKGLPVSNLRRKAPTHKYHNLYLTNIRSSITPVEQLQNLCIPHRRLVCFCRLFEVYDVTKKERIGQHQREIFLFNDLLLVTKLARRVRANPSQAYTYRQSIPLQGLSVQLFQSQHYLYGIRLCKRSDDETLIMFNARNELDQSRFVDDLSESIAEMDEMETIKMHNLIETIHFRQQERLRRHRMSHTLSENAEDKSRPHILAKMIEKCDTAAKNSNIETTAHDKLSNDLLEQIGKESDECLSPKTNQKERKVHGKFSSMLNLSSNHNDSGRTQPKGLRLNHSFVQNASQPQQPCSSDNQSGGNNDSGSSGQRRCSTGSVHSLDSGLFLSRDISPNQSS